MSIVSRQIGIDIGAETLVVSIDQGRPFNIANSKLGIAEIVGHVNPGDVFHLEASGGYERAVVRALRKAGADVRVHDPLKARRLAQGRGRKAKTDLIDSVELSLDGNLLPVHTPKSEARENLTDISRAISALQETAVSLTQRSGRLDIDRDAYDAFRATVCAIQEQIKGLEAKFRERAEAAGLKQKLEMAMSIPGVGIKTARVCICELPEDLSERTAEQITAYAGLAPIDHSSGKTKAPAAIGNGNRKIKAALYMAALNAMCRQTWAKQLYARLRGKGRSHRQAIVAVMRRLLVRIVAVLKRGTPWTEEPPNNNQTTGEPLAA